MNDMIIRLLRMGYSMNDAEIIADFADNVCEKNNASS